MLNARIELFFFLHSVGKSVSSKPLMRKEFSGNHKCFILLKCVQKLTSFDDMRSKDSKPASNESSK